MAELAEGRREGAGRRSAGLPEGHALSQQRLRSGAACACLLEALG